MQHGFHGLGAGDHRAAVVELHVVFGHFGHGAHGLVHDQRAMLAVHVLHGENESGAFGCHWE